MDSEMHLSEWVCIQKYIPPEQGLKLYIQPAICIRRANDSEVHSTRTRIETF